MLRQRMAERWGPARLSVAIRITRTVFKYAWDSRLIGQPVFFGPQFKRPSASVLRRHRAMQGPKLFTAEEIRRLIEAANPTLRAMILLGINCGFGNADCGKLPLSAVDLDNAILDFPRPKTGIPRRCPLWPQTVAALQEVLAKRPAAKSKKNAQLVFLTKYGESWNKATSDTPITQAMKRLLNQLGLYKRKGLGFYTLRHTFRTIADETKDQPAVDLIMGHEVAHMSTVYRETISDARLKAVVEHVHQGLFGSRLNRESPSPEGRVDSL